MNAEQLERMLPDVVAGVAVVDRTCSLRTGTELYCIRKAR